MNIRYRLFLWVGSLFFLAFIASFYIENYLTEKRLTKAEAKLRKEAMAQSEIKRLYYEEFLYLSFLENSEEINGLLEYIWEYPQLRENFDPTLKHFQNGTWPQSALLLTRNKWVEFWQNTNESKLASLIIPTRSVFRASAKIPIEEGIAWVFLADDYFPPDSNKAVDPNIIDALQTQEDGQLRIKRLPYIAVDIESLPYVNVFGGPPSLQEEEAQETFHSYVLFSNDDVLQFAKNVKQEDLVAKSSSLYTQFSTQESSELVNERFAIFFNRLMRAAGHVQQMLKETSNDKDKQELWFQKLIDQYHLAHGQVPEAIKNYMRCAEKSLAYSKQGFHNILHRYEQITMIAQINTLLLSGYFGSSPQDPHAPKGIARFLGQDVYGNGFYSSDVFFRDPLFADQMYYEKNDRGPGCEPIGAFFALIFDPREETLFLGNTLKLESGDSKDRRKGYVTAGVQIENIIEKLSLVIHQTTFLVHEGRPLVGFSQDGIRVPMQDFQTLPIQDMLEVSDGRVTFEDKRYFFIHMKPFKQIDLHVFSMNLESNEFALVDQIKKESKDVLKNISMDMRLVLVAAVVIALILLHNLSKRITRPITILAKAAEAIGKGHLQDVYLPHPPKGRYDEIATLCNSFDHMIQGLLEKEKVEGVLNKVVSHEIAEEILKGHVHLGGEEKTVTMLFADIRDFSEMTQKMPPQDVIEMLNTCMTKISNVVDEHGGVIDKYIGDAVMALYGAPVQHEDSALQAVISAISMAEVLKAWNVERALKNQRPVEMGFGVHTGNVVVGNMGAENRLNYTVIGSGVNLSSRLCSVAGAMEILISIQTLEAPFVKDKIDVEAMPLMTLKGFAESIPIFRVIGLKKVVS